MRKVPEIIAAPKPNTKAFVDLSGEEIGRLTVISYAGFNTPPCGKRRHFWRCVCECGEECTKAHLELFRGETLSCGCLQKELLSQRSKKHDLSHSAEYIAWRSIKQRCTYENHVAYPRFGGRGIKICDRWANSFDLFLFDVGPRPSDVHFLSRVDLDGHYEPSNCTWRVRARAAA